MPAVAVLAIIRHGLAAFFAHAAPFLAQASDNTILVRNCLAAELVNIAFASLLRLAVILGWAVPLHLCKDRRRRAPEQQRGENGKAIFHVEPLSRTGPNAEGSCTVPYRFEVPES